MDDLLTRFGADLSPSVIWIAALAVGALLLALAVRSFFGSRSRRHRAQHARLAIVDVEEVDGRRRLVLLRRDDVEHLVMIGGPGDVVIETNIGRRAAGSGAPLRQQPAKGTEGRDSTSRPPVKKVEPAPVASARPPVPQVEPAAASAPPVEMPRPTPAPNPVRVEPTAATPNIPVARRETQAELDGEIQELLDQMGRDRSSKPA